MKMLPRPLAMVLKFLGTFGKRVKIHLNNFFYQSAGISNRFTENERPLAMVTGQPLAMVKVIFDQS